jgi:hypothetical protein
VRRKEVGQGRRITQKLWQDEDEWLDFFREDLCGHPEPAETITRIWFAPLGRLFQEPCRTKAQAILNQAPRSTVDAAHLSVYPVIPAGVPALPAVSNRIRQAG